MSELILKVGGNGIMQQAKKAFIADAKAAVAKKNEIGSVILNGGMTVANVMNTTAQAYQGHPGMASFWGLFTACFGTLFGISLKDLMLSIKSKKQTSQALKDIVSRKDFMNIFNRYLRIKGKKELSSEQLLEIYKKADKTKFFQ